MLYILKIPTKFSVVPQSFRQNQNPHQGQDQQFTSNIITRITFYI